MMGGQSLSLPVIAGLALTPVLISIGQVLFKLTSKRTVGASANDVLQLLLDPYLLLALGIYGFGTIVWVYVLKSVPLTFAYPFMALTFCAVPLLAAVFLGETVGLRYALGTAMIVGGLVVINS